MALNLTSVLLPKSQVLGPFLPTHPENGCSINDAKAIIEYLKQLPQVEVKFDIEGHLSPQDLKKIKPYLYNDATIELSWNKSSFVY